MRAPSFQKYQRSDAHCLQNCIGSIIEDQTFVAEVLLSECSDFVVFGNLRCGAWYVEPDAARLCHFKSTDGHHSNWDFSLRRLNLEVAIAAATGPVLIVDATRKGKAYPDAFSKTIPIWACVINRAVNQLRARATTSTTLQSDDWTPASQPVNPLLSNSPASAQHLRTIEPAHTERPLAGPATGRLPSSPPTEQTPPPTTASPQPSDPASTQLPTAQLDESLYLPSWVTRSEAAQIEAKLPLWTRKLLDLNPPQLQHVAAVLRAPLRSFWAGQASPPTAEEVQGIRSLPISPMLLLSASRQAEFVLRPAMNATRVPWPYRYVAGAADDEEHWARGVHPRHLWAARSTLLSSPPHVLDALLEHMAKQPAATPTSALEAIARSKAADLAREALADPPPRGIVDGEVEDVCMEEGNSTYRPIHAVEWQKQTKRTVYTDVGMEDGPPQGLALGGKAQMTVLQGVALQESNEVNGQQKGPAVVGEAQPTASEGAGTDGGNNANGTGWGRWTQRAPSEGVGIEDGNAANGAALGWGKKMQKTVVGPQERGFGSTACGQEFQSMWGEGGERAALGRQHHGEGTGAQGSAPLHRLPPRGLVDAPRGVAAGQGPHRLLGGWPVWIFTGGQLPGSLLAAATAGGVHEVEVGDAGGTVGSDSADVAPCAGPGGDVAHRGVGGLEGHVGDDFGAHLAAGTVVVVEFVDGGRTEKGGDAAWREFAGHVGPHVLSMGALVGHVARWSATKTRAGGQDPRSHDAPMPGRQLPIGHSHAVEGQHPGSFTHSQAARKQLHPGLPLDREQMVAMSWVGAQPDPQDQRQPSESRGPATAHVDDGSRARCHGCGCVGSWPLPYEVAQVFPPTGDAVPVWHILEKMHVRCYVADSKADRLGLWRALGPLLLLIFAHVASGRAVVLAGNDDVATCVGVAVTMAERHAGLWGGDLPTTDAQHKSGSPRGSHGSPAPSVVYQRHAAQYHHVDSMSTATDCLTNQLLTPQPQRSMGAGSLSTGGQTAPGVVDGHAECTGTANFAQNKVAMRQDVGTETCLKLIHCVVVGKTGLLVAAPPIGDGGVEVAPPEGGPAMGLREHLSLDGQQAARLGKGANMVLGDEAKTGVRKCLAVVSAGVPGATASRGTLKQVQQFFYPPSVLPKRL